MMSLNRCGDTLLRLLTLSPRADPSALSWVIGCFLVMPPIHNCAVTPLLCWCNRHNGAKACSRRTTGAGRGCPNELHGVWLVANLLGTRVHSFARAHVCA